jgi:transcriptional regulator with GAF, ATPase, and Fis domain
MGTTVGTLEHGEMVMQRRPTVRWTDGEGAHESRIDDLVLVGSAPGLPIEVHDRTVSRIHAELESRGDGLWVRDLGSRNGTYINEIRVTQGRVPHDGSLRLGSSTLHVHYDVEQVEVATWNSERFGPLMGTSLVMRRLFARLARMAATESSVLIVGETGSGKELVARAIHAASPRHEGPLVVVDCAALPESLIEAELFGHAKGAFTGAGEARAGSIEAADGGTVFLDEIGELPLAVQPKLLRALEAREIRRVGEAQHKRVDVRFLSATNRDLREMVNAGAFREDLFFRLAVLLVQVPPLRERVEDIPLLVGHHQPAGTAPLDAELMAELSKRPWLGNVRELRNFVERVHALGAEEALAMSWLPAGAPAAPTDTPSLDGPYKALRERWIEHFERSYFTALLARHQSDVAAAAREAGVDRTYVYRMIRRHRL